MDVFLDVNLMNWVQKIHGETRCVTSGTPARTLLVLVSLLTSGNLKSQLNGDFRRPKFGRAEKWGPPFLLGPLCAQKPYRLSRIVNH